MSGFRDIKRQARRVLHDQLQVPALYLRSTTSTPVPCTVRVWTKWGKLGQLTGAGAGWAEAQETAPKIIFVDASFTPRANGIVSVEAGEAYRIDSTEPADDISITALVSRLDPRNPGDKAVLDALPLPVDLSPVGTGSPPQVGSVDLRNLTGHAVYTHTGATQQLAANVEVALVNDRGSADETQKPTDIDTFYDGTAITGRTGDGLGGELRFTLVPTDDTVSMLTISIDIGGSIGRVFTVVEPVAQGAAIEHKFRIPFLLYQRATWAADGGTVLVKSDGPAQITSVQYVIHRLHKAR